MIDPLMRDLSVGGAVLGNLSAFYFYAYAGLQIPVGIMLDRWGPQRVLSVAAAFAAVGSMLFATADSLPLVYAGRLMIGAGSAFGFVGSLKLAGIWFPPRRFGQLSGLTLMAGMIGGIAGQAPLALLIESTGWRPALMGAGAVGAVLSLAIWAIVRDRPAATTMPAPTPAPADHDSRPLALLWRVVGRPQNLALAFVGAAMTAPLLAFAGLWGVAWLMQAHGMARPEAAATTSLLLIGWAFGAPLAGTVSDRLRRRKPVLVAAAAGGFICLCALLYAPIAPGVVLSGLFFTTGLFLGGMVVSYALTRDANPTRLTGTAIAFVNMVVTATGALFQPLIGALLDRRWDGAMIDGARLYAPEAYRGALSVLAVFLFMGLLVSLAIHETGARATPRDLDLANVAPARRS